jgi:hypothetical protein
MLVIRERAAVVNERTLILTDDVDVSHPEGDAYIDEQRVTLCAVQRIISYDHGIDYSYPIPRGVASTLCKAPRDSISSSRHKMETPGPRHPGGEGSTSPMLDGIGGSHQRTQARSGAFFNREPHHIQSGSTVKAMQG